MSLLAFVVTKHNGVQSTFGPPDFSWKTNSNVSTSSVCTRSCTT